MTSVQGDWPGTLASGAGRELRGPSEATQMLRIRQQGANLPPLGSRGVTSCSVDARVIKPRPAGLSLTAPRAHAPGQRSARGPRAMPLRQGAGSLYSRGPLRNPGGGGESAGRRTADGLGLLSGPSVFGEHTLEQRTAL